MIPKSKSEFISGVNISPELHNAITVNVNVTPVNIKNGTKYPKKKCKGVINILV